MRILIFHGYLLAGTGSNVYNARLAEAFVHLGHEVHLLSQERHPERLPFIDACADWDGGALRVRALTRGQARCTLYRPDIGRLLPVYVEDSYEGLEARAFQRCDDREIDGYLQANVAAVAEVCGRVAPEIALANHLVLGPSVLARGLPRGVPYAVKVHGSALEYTVKRAPQRFLEHAREGVRGASGVLVGSRHTAESLWEALGADWVERHRIVARTRLGPPGVDVSRFTPLPRAEAAPRLAALSARLAASGRSLAEKRPAPSRSPRGASGEAGAPRADQGAPAADAFSRDEQAIARALSDLDLAAGPIVAYVGKLIVSKGVDLLIAAWPLVLSEMPEAQLAIVGFGSLRSGLEGLLAALASGDLAGAREIARAGRELEGGPRAPLRHLLAFLDSLSGESESAYLAGCAALAGRARFVGRLDHDELAGLLPACDALVVPSTFPEAFGMVAAEAAACGALPISAAHSGLAEVSDALSLSLPSEVARLLSFPVDDAVVETIAARVLGWLSLEPSVRAQAGAEIVEVVRRRWSWEGVAKGVIAAAMGSLGALPRP